MKPVLQKAYNEKYAVGAFNVINLNFLEAIVESAVKRKSPVILNIAEAHFKYVTLENIVPAIKSMSQRVNVDIVLNLDHGLTMGGIQRAISNGFTNIMFDGSHLGFDENIRRTREVVEVCHSAGVSVEAELGAVGGDEGGALYGEADPNKYTDVAQAGQFVKETGIDFLALAYGNSHGKYKGEPDLDFELLKAVKDITGIPLVLHGGTGISTEGFQKSIQLGVSKINFFTGMSEAALKATAEYMSTVGETYDDYPLMLERVKTAISNRVAEQMDIFGSSGKA